MKVIVLMHEIWELGYNVSKKVNLFAKWTITNNHILYEVYITVQERWTWFLWQVIIALISVCRHLSAPKRQHCQVTYVVVTLLFILAFVYLYTYISLKWGGMEGEFHQESWWLGLGRWKRFPLKKECHQSPLQSPLLDTCTSFVVHPPCRLEGLELGVEGFLFAKYVFYKLDEIMID